MEIQLKSRNIPSFELIGKSSNICTVSTDTVVPDSSDDILRIVSSDYCCKIRSKDINNDKIIIGGEVEAVIAYIPETGEGICTVSTQSSFETVFDVLGADGTCAVFADVKVIGFDCRIANPRKIHVQCEVAVFQECYKANEINVYSEYDELPECTYLKKEKSELFRISEVTEKTISIEEDIPMGETDGLKLLSAYSYFFIGEAEQIGEKLIVKGSCITDALFFDGKNIKNKSFKNDFSQLFNLMCTAEKSVFRVNVLPTGEYYELQDNYFVMDIRAVVELVCYDKTEIEYYADAYSTKCDLQIEHCSLEAVKSLKVQNLKLNDTVKYTSGDNISGIISARVHNTELRFSDVGISLPYTVDIVYLTDDGTIKSCKLRKSAEEEVHIDGEKIGWSCVNIIECSVSSNGETIECSVNAEVKVETEKRCTVEQITSLESGEESNSCTRPSLYLCRAGDDSLWTLAKKYYSSVDDITAINGIEDGAEIKGKLLLIPSKK